jgi:hypothetical protein
MPLLGTLLVNMLAFLINIFAKYMVLEKAFRLSAVMLMLSLVGVMIALMSSCAKGVCASGISGMSSSHPSFAVGLGMVFNSTTLSAATCYVTVWLGCQLYVVQKKGLNLVVK